MDAFTQVNSPIHQDQNTPILVIETTTSLPPNTIALPPPHYEEELEALIGIVEKAKHHYKEATDEINSIREQAQNRETELQHLLDTRTTAYMKNLQDMEEKVVVELQRAKDELATAMQTMEEGYQLAFNNQNNELLNLWLEHASLQKNFNDQMRLLLNFEQEKHRPNASLEVLEVTSQQKLEQSQQEMEAKKAKLIQNNKQDMEVIQKEVDRMCTFFRIVQIKLQNEVLTTQDELQTLRAKYEMGEARVKALIGSSKIYRWEPGKWFYPTFKISY